ncbi:MAG TPA: amino acid permease [Dehalococcoidia bacterium]|nr:amino acid permease [Dehalococcoidia bacterium]
MPTAASPRKSLGLWSSTGLVAGNMIGSGIFLLPASLALYGPISLVGWVITATGALFLALVFANLGRAYPKTGGPYEYSRRAFGDFIGFQVAWGYWIAVWAGNAAIAVAAVAYAGEFWHTLSDEAIVGAAAAIACIWSLTLINLAGVKPGGQVSLLTTVLKIIPLLAIATVGLFYIDGANFSPFNASGDGWFSAVRAAAPLTLWAFIGLESATVPAEDVENPSRIIPLSTMLGTIVTTAIYILSTVVVFGVIATPELAESTAPFSDAAKSMWGSEFGRLVTIGAVISAYGCLNGWILLSAQVPMAAARDGLFPSVFSRLNSRGAPVVGLVVSSALASGLVLTNYTSGLVDAFTEILLLATLTTLVPYAFSSMAQLLLLVSDREAFSAKNFVRDAVIAAVAFAYTMWAIEGAGQEVVFKGFLLILAGTPVYVGMRWYQLRKSAPASQPATVPMGGAGVLAARIDDEVSRGS